jgi:DNA-binding MarR family transcriptional regulator
MIWIMKLISNHLTLARLVGRFLGEMHRHDAGRTLPLLHAAKLTTPQLAVLEFTATPRTVSTVALHVGLSRPATSQMIDKLVKRRLIRRFEGEVDRREKAVALTAKGRALLEKIGNARTERFAASIAALPPSVAGRLRSALKQAVAAMEKLPQGKRNAGMGL